MNRKKKYITIADLLTDDSFLAWQLQKENCQDPDWENWVTERPEHVALTREAARVLKVLVSLKERRFSAYQVNASIERLLKEINNNKLQFIL